MAVAVDEMASSCPEARGGHNSAIVDDVMIVWGGQGSENRFFSHEIVWNLNLETSLWSKRLATFEKPEDLPRSSIASQIAVVNREIYQFGGASSLPTSDFLNDLHMLNELTLEWTRVVSAEPIPDGRRSCGMCLLGDHLVVMGGYGDGVSKEKGGVWRFSLDERKWKYLECHGSSPCHRYGHSFTAIDERRAVLIGGRAGLKFFSDSFIFNLDSQEWTEISSTFMPDQPIPRSSHSAIFLNVEGRGPYLFMFWGQDGTYNITPTGVVIELQSMEFKQVGICDMCPTFEQTMCAVQIRATQFHFIRFGGFSGITPWVQLSKLEWDAESPDKFSLINPNSSSCWTSLKLLSVDVKDIEFDEKDLIGGGGFAEVYRATMKETNQTVALKIMLRRRRTSSEAAVLLKEVSVLLGVEPHPNIVKTFGVCDSLRCYGLIMEYVNGGDLAQLLASSGQEMESWHIRVDIAIQVAVGMAHLHGNSPSIIHLDLKPRNVLIEKPNFAAASSKFICKICDFGLSKMAGVSSLTEDRSDGSIPAGTIAYIAPERYIAYGSGTKEEKMEVAKKSDVFSYGVLLWEIQERKPPFEGYRKEAVVLYIQSGQQIPKARSHSPAGFHQLQVDCNTFDPRERPNFAEIEGRLNRILLHVK